MNIKEEIDEVISWLKFKVKETNTKGLVVGLSGGIDSSVVAYLINKALPDNSLAVILPIKNSKKDMEDAVKVAERIGIKYKNIDLEEPHKLILSSVKKSLSEDYKEDKLTDGNLRARLRMSTLYTIANNMNYLVVGTDNKAELITGYFTKYGDGGVDILPISHLKKSQVYEWAKYMNLPNEVIEKKPSAGLYENQTDETELKVTYDAIDKFIDKEEVSQKDYHRIVHLYNITEHKRNTPAKFKS